MTLTNNTVKAVQMSSNLASIKLQKKHLKAGTQQTEIITRGMSAQIAPLLKGTCDQKSGQEFNLSCSRD